MLPAAHSQQRQCRRMPRTRKPNQRFVSTIRYIIGHGVSFVLMSLRIRRPLDRLLQGRDLDLGDNFTLVSPDLTEVSASRPPTLKSDTPCRAIC